MITNEQIERSKSIGYCIKCGRCCWNWKGLELGHTDDPSSCEYLGDDMKTCTIYDEWEKYNLSQCRNRHTLLQASSLPDDCGYMIAWREAGLI